MPVHRHVRVAFGAAPRDVIRLVLGEVSLLLISGLGIGVALSLVVIRVIESRLVFPGAM